jgi:hypothetical protein
MANMLSQLLNPQAKPVGTGMAEQGRQALLARAYSLHVQEAQAMGQQPMPLEQFIAQQR